MARKFIISREEALEKLADHGIQGPEIYLIDVIPLIEMIWADGKTQKGELAILENFLAEHVSHINTIAGYEVLTTDMVRAFVSRFLKEKPSPELLQSLRELIPPVRFMCSEEDGRLRDSILAACMDIAASSVVEYPYGWNERFDPAEKKCFFEILDALDKGKPECEDDSD